MRNIVLTGILSLLALFNKAYSTDLTEQATKGLDFCKYPELYPNINLHIGYWSGFRGRANLLRLVNELSKLSYTIHSFGGFNEEGLYEFSDWHGLYKGLIAKIDPTSQPNLPFLVDCTNTRKTKYMTETLDLMIYLAEKYNPQLLGEGLGLQESLVKSASVTANEFFSGWSAQIMGKEGSVESVLSSDDFFSDGDIVSGPMISLFQAEEFLRDKVDQFGGPLCFGIDPTIPDIFLYEYANIMDTIFPGIISDYPYLRGLLDAFNDNPIVSGFFNSDRSVIYPPVVAELLPFQYFMAFNPRKTLISELPKFGQYLMFYGHSESTSAASVCLANKIFRVASSNVGSEILNDIYGLLQFSQIVDVGVRIVGRNALVRFWYRITRKSHITKRNMKRSCVAIITSGKYHQVSLTRELAEEICASFVNCYTNRGTAWNITKTLTSASKRYKFFGGSTQIFNAERFFKKYLTSPLLFAKAIRFYYTSKSVANCGSLSKRFIVGFLTEAQKQNAISTYGITLNNDLAVRICIGYSGDKGLHSFSDSCSISTLCKKALSPFDLNEEQRISTEKSASIVSLLEQIAN
ncbi:hypothetical protein FG386_003488 [Cryptosporidium ryanae]|uniref:uncharacterized protein n=1 Tax=Cryptosporidium ryanae TaxID=515981 RepID=UPI00351A1906|nr:hypothetical protein FG386_003488 [Cryptosporidium ryanae]